MDLDDLFGAAPPPVKTEPVQCPPPGVYFDVPAHVYHSWPAISSTLLKNYAELPFTSRDALNVTDDIAVGSGIHAYTLQGEKGLAEECFILPPECEGKGKAAKQERERIAGENPHKVLLPHRYGTGAAESKPPIMDVLNGVDASFRSHPKTGPILQNSKKEVSLVWVDAGTGVTCKARLDVWQEPVIWDLKKCQDISRFQWQIKDLFYHVQAGHYFNGAVACGLKPVAFGFLPCEAVHPYRVGCGYIEPEKLIAAQAEAERLISLVVQSQLSGEWPNYQIPAHIFNLGDVKPDDLVMVW